MELHAYTRTISDLFSVKRKYIVPRFQREYSWTKEQIKELWDDITSNIKIESDNIHHEEYFIGSLVLVGDDKSPNHLIVDGQQRLTTLTILLSALCQRFVEIDKENIAKAIYDNYIAGKDDDGKAYFKLENENPKPFFQTTIQHIEKEKNKPETEEEKTLLSSYEDLYAFTAPEALKSIFNNVDISKNDQYEMVLKAVRDQVAKYLKVIFITVAEEDEAYTIFETLNARGMNLSFVDLIKNKIFKTLKNTHPDDSAKTKWKKIAAHITSRDNVGTLDGFVRHWWISQYPYVSSGKIYKAFKDEWNKGNIDANKFIDSLLKDSIEYTKLSSPVIEDYKQQEEKQIYKSLMALKTFGIIQHKPFVMSLFRAKSKKHLKQNDIIEALIFLEKFHFMFNAVCSMRASGIEGIFAKAARDISNASNMMEAKNAIKELYVKFKDKLPDKKTFEENFQKFRFTNDYTKDKKIIQYIFYYIEDFKQPSQEFQPYNITLEHILSQSSTSGKYIGSIGNLLPLGKELNNEAGDKLVLDKLLIYKKSQYRLTREFADKAISTWEHVDITKRAEELAIYCYSEVWKIS